MPVPLRAREILATLAEHRVRYVLIGGLAAVLHGAAVMTTDADVCPDPEPGNLRRLCAALEDMHARIRAPDNDEGIPFSCDPALLQQMKMLNMVTDFGNFDLSFEPAGFRYEELASHAQVTTLGGASVPLAALDDVIESKRLADRPKDQAALPHLYALRDEIAAQERGER
jgi:hypothetical protein